MHVAPIPNSLKLSASAAMQASPTPGGIEDYTPFPSLPTHKTKVANKLLTVCFLIQNLGFVLS